MYHILLLSLGFHGVPLTPGTPRSNFKNCVTNKTSLSKQIGVVNIKISQQIKKGNRGRYFAAILIGEFVM